MATGDAPITFGGYQWILKIGDATSNMFFSATPPSASIDAPEFKTWAETGEPVNSISGGRQVTWAPVTISRGADKDMELWTWFTDIMQKGAVADTKKEVELTCMSHEGETLF